MHRAALLLALLLLPAGPARAQGPLALSPSRIDVVAGWGDALPPIAVTNEGAQPIALRVRALPATQAPDGLPRWSTDARAVAEGERRFAVAPRALTLLPGATRRVRVRVTACPATGQGLYGVVAFEPAGAAPAARLELAATLLVRWPAQGCLDGRVADARVEQRGPRLALVAGLQNLGTVHGVPQVELLVRRDGRVVRRARAPGATVLPGAVRDLARLVARPALPAGRYELVVRGRFGHARLERRKAFELDGPDRLAARSAAPAAAGGAEDDRPVAAPGAASPPPRAVAPPSRAGSPPTAGAARWLAANAVTVAAGAAALLALAAALLARRDRRRYARRRAS